jgi:hypothetical protein
MDYNRPASSSDLNPLNIFMWEYLKIKVYGCRVSSREAPCYQIQQFASEIENTPRIFECLQVSFSHRAELFVHEHGGHFEHFLYESKNKEIAYSSFVCFFQYITC